MHTLVRPFNTEHFDGDEALQPSQHIVGVENDGLVVNFQNTGQASVCQLINFVFLKTSLRFVPTLKPGNFRMIGRHFEHQLLLVIPPCDLQLDLIPGSRHNEGSLAELKSASLS
eukprot:TRINITY_DN3991_c3_g2_i2.p2 TRINITY_DN3991_c3_g2~~TRINITY_DN3991_c3_g2_i2.p2  ORF type:complete len:114 (-),score=1.99 TRINITY_DN3991_c3_g2_i2:38-379(-)